MEFPQKVETLQTLESSKHWSSLPPTPTHTTWPPSYLHIFSSCLLELLSLYSAEEYLWKIPSLYMVLKHTRQTRLASPHKFHSLSNSCSWTPRNFIDRAGFIYLWFQTKLVYTVTSQITRNTCREISPPSQSL